MIVQVPVGAVVKQLREGVRKADARGREGEPRQKGRGRETAMLEDAAIHEYLSSGWREGTSSGRAGRQLSPRGRATSIPFPFFVGRNHGNQNFI